MTTDPRPAAAASVPIPPGSVPNVAADAARPAVPAPPVARTAVHQQLAIARMEADAQSRLAHAEMLLAETQLRCARLVDEARHEAHMIIREARAAAQRMHAEVQARETGIDVRPRASSSFSELWELAEEDHDVDSFFLTIPQRTANDVFSA